MVRSQRIIYLSVSLERIVGGVKMDKLTIKQVRVLNDLSQKQMAFKLDMPLGTYQKKEQGRSPFTFLEVVKICETFNVDINKIQVD